MPAYPSEGSLVDVLVAMRDIARENRNKLVGIDRIEVGGGLYYPPWDDTALYLIPSGSPETTIGEHGSKALKRATHRVQFEIVRAVDAVDPDEFLRTIIGTSAETGLMAILDSVADFYENNWLNLSGIDSGIAPETEIPENAYEQVWQEEDGERIVFTIARGLYHCTSRPFERTTD